MENEPYYNEMERDFRTDQTADITHIFRIEEPEIKRKLCVKARKILGESFNLSPPSRIEYVSFHRAESLFAIVTYDELKGGISSPYMTALDGYGLSSLDSLYDVVKIIKRDLSKQRLLAELL